MIILKHNSKLIIHNNNNKVIKMCFKKNASCGNGLPLVFNLRTFKHLTLDPLIMQVIGL